VRALEDYATSYQNARLTRDDKGILEVTLHTDGGPLVWNESAHRELPLLFADISNDAQNRVVILTGTGDAPHFPNGVVAGDGVHIVWPLLLGPNRGRYFLLTGQELSAEEALRLNVVGEVLPADQLLPRARELARQLADKPITTLRYTRVALTQRLKRHLLDDLGYGLMLESRAAVANSTPTTQAWTGQEQQPT
jgi:enoyl-CoA hydratase/carnithine racemase